MPRKSNNGAVTNGQVDSSACFFVPSSTGKIRTDKFIKPQSQNQRVYVEAIKKKTVIICTGPAGTGKTQLALFNAIQLANQEDSPIEKIVYIRANVSLKGEEGLGFLPGGLTEKVMPLALPVLDNLIQFMPHHQALYLIESGRIEVTPVAMVRGRSFASNFVIVDEAQNCSPSMVKTLLTRIGQGSKMVLIGDESQTDINSKSGLLDAANRLNGLESVGVIHFNKSDIIRHPIIPDILDRYED